MKTKVYFFATDNNISGFVAGPNYLEGFFAAKQKAAEECNKGIDDINITAFSIAG